jgi:phosphoglycerate kinase
MAAGDVVMLENIRFDAARDLARTTPSAAALADELVALAGDDGAFVSDGFGVVHRKQASVYDVAQRPRRPTPAGWCCPRSRCSAP